MKKIQSSNLFVLIAMLFMLSPFSSVAQQKVKILSYNVLYGLQKDSANVDRYRDLIAKLDPDIVATQEMNDFTQKSLEQLSNSYGHPYALQSKEEGFPVALTSKTPMLNFKKVTENMWHSSIYAKVKGIHIFVIHFSPFNYKKRLEEVTNIIAQAKDLPADEPILIMGDFNSLSAADSANYDQQMVEGMREREKKQDHIRNLNNNLLDYSVLNKLEEAGFTDTYWLTNKNFTGTVPTFKDGNGKVKDSNAGKQRRIDYIWCNEAAKKHVTKSVVIKDELTHYISDHYPMYLELVF